MIFRVKYRKHLDEKSYSNFVLFVLQILYLSSHSFLDKRHCVHFLLEFITKNCRCILAMLDMLVSKRFIFSLFENIYHALKNGQMRKVKWFMRVRRFQEKCSKDSSIPALSENLETILNDI